MASGGAPDEGAPNASFPDNYVTWATSLTDRNFMRPISDSDHAKPALIAWGAGGVETISYYEPDADATRREDKLRDW